MRYLERSLEGSRGGYWGDWGVLLLERTGRVLLAERWGRASPCNLPQPGPCFSCFLSLWGVNCIYRCRGGTASSGCKGFASRWGPAACHKCHKHGMLCMAAGTQHPVELLPHPRGPASPWEWDVSVPVTSCSGWHILAWCRRLGFLRFFSFLRAGPADLSASASFLLIQLRGMLQHGFVQMRASARAPIPLF